MGRDIDRTPRRVFFSEEAPGEVVLMPPRHIEKYRGSGSEAGHGRRRPKLPHRFTGRLRVGLGTVFDGVVDNKDVDGAAGHAAVDAGREDAADSVG